MSDFTDQPVYQILYVSATSEFLGESELEALLARSRKHNVERGITGLLLYCEGNVIHLIEGPENAVEDLFARIQKDPRHRSIIRMFSGPAPQRDFPEWSMGYSRVSNDEAEVIIPGFSNFLNDSSLAESKLAEVSKKTRIFLETFRAMAARNRSRSDSAA